MMRNTSSSMQKTYDDCYLTCSTAVYFEGQNNEAEALRSWRSALDQIYYHNAYKVPANYRPKSETERALQDSLKDMEMQCKERVDLLEALQESRIDAKKAQAGGSPSGFNMAAAAGSLRTPRESQEQERGWLGEGTIPAVKFPDLSRPGGPPLPQRPAVLSKKSSGQDVPRSPIPPQTSGTNSRLTASPPTLPVPRKVPSRSPSPEKKGMLTTLRNTRDVKRMSRSPRASNNRRQPAAAAKAATQAWGTLPRNEADRLGQSLDAGSTTTLGSLHGGSMSSSPPERRESRGRPSTEYTRAPGGNPADRPGSSDLLPKRNAAFNGARPSSFPQTLNGSEPESYGKKSDSEAPQTQRFPPAEQVKAPPQIVVNKPVPPPKPPMKHNIANYDWKAPEGESSSAVLENGSRNSKDRPRSMGIDERTDRAVRRQAPNPKGRSDIKTSDRPVTGRPMANSSAPRPRRQQRLNVNDAGTSWSEDDSQSSGVDGTNKPRQRQRKQREQPITAESLMTDSSDTHESPILTPSEKAWKERTEYLLKNLPKGVDEAAAKQIFNEIVIQGDEVHWDDVAGLDVAKNALKEAVVYPFLRPDLFLGLREPARGMLLFGPPGTGKTMLARAVATESKSTFFSISASSLTSKYLGESEKLVRALFSLARALAPSIIFVDEIDSLLSSRSGSGEHEATRRIKTEFLIQWSDLARAAAGRDPAPDKDKEKGDPTRVLVLAATNLPWAIDEAARRRFVRRQYIPLPEGRVRATQLRTLLSHQKHSLDDADIESLIELTDSFSGSDITALAKDAAMGPLRSLGEALLHMSTDQIRPIGMQDFEKSLVSIRPSVSSKGLQEFEEWARDFGERGG